jgi:hypothetical protein
MWSVAGALALVAVLLLSIVTMIAYLGGVVLKMAGELLEIVTDELLAARQTRMMLRMAYEAAVPVLAVGHLVKLHRFVAKAEQLAVARHKVR